MLSRGDQEAAGRYWFVASLFHSQAGPPNVAGSSSGPGAMAPKVRSAATRGGSLLPRALRVRAEVLVAVPRSGSASVAVTSATGTEVRKPVGKAKKKKRVHEEAAWSLALSTFTVFVSCFHLRNQGVVEGACWEGEGSRS